MIIPYYKNKYYCVLIFFTAFFYLLPDVKAQQPENTAIESETDISDKLEEIASSYNSNFDYTGLLSGLKYFKDNPLNINSASADDLQKLIFLNDIQIFNLLAYRENFGSFVSVYELQAIEGFDYETIRKILPYITVGKPVKEYKPSFGKIIKSLNNQIIVRYQRIVQTKTGYTGTNEKSRKYLGAPGKIYFRYLSTYKNKIKLGLIMEKDPGEPFIKSNALKIAGDSAGITIRNGFDFYSAFLSVSDIGRIRNITVGNYSLKFGQGLILWTGLAFGKSADVINVSKQERAIQPYTSTDENNYMSGVATTVRINNFDITGFYSKHKIDALLSGFYDTEIAVSLPETGLHRTIEEIARKDAVSIEACGANTTFRSNNFKTGLTAISYNLNKPLLKNTRPYNMFDFQGDHDLNIGLNFNYISGKTSIFGEMGFEQNRSKWAGIAGVLFYPFNRLAITFLYRNYSPGYIALFGNAFSESGYTSNEQGIYTGVKVFLHKQWTLSVYYDNFRFPWLRYRINSPSYGNDYLAQLDFIPSNNVSIYFRFKRKTKQVNNRKPYERMPYVENICKSSYRFNIAFSVSPSVTLKSRAEYLNARDEAGYHGNGFLAYQDIIWKPVKSSVSLTARYAIFDTDTYNERIYAYENDLLYSFSIPPYYYKGSRIYVLAKFNFHKRITVWIRAANTLFDNKQVIGSGYESISGNCKTEIKGQIRIKF